MAEQENKNNRTNFVKYTGMGFQMLATIGIFSFGGYKLDQYLKNDKPICMAVLGLIGVIVSLYQVVRDLNGKS